MKKMRPFVSLANEVDRAVAAADHVEVFDQYKGRWIKTIRLASGYTASELASKLDISQQSLSELEAREGGGVVSVKKLETIAGAMNCKFVYGFVPNQPVSALATSLQVRQEDARGRHRRIPRPA